MVILQFSPVRDIACMWYTSIGYIGVSRTNPAQTTEINTILFSIIVLRINRDV